MLITSLHLTGPETKESVTGMYGEVRTVPDGGLLKSFGRRGGVGSTMTDYGPRVGREVVEGS